MAGKKKALSAPYYSIGQLRLDHWNALKNESIDLSHCRRGSANEAQHKEKVHELLKDLKTVEQYFAIPGKATIEKLIKALGRREHAALANKVTQLTRQLVADEYMGNDNVSIENEGEQPEIEDNAEQFTSAKKNYFEVLFLEDLSTSDEAALHMKIRDLHDPSDEFNYNITVQHSFQDALIALFFNHNIQAVVIRYAPSYRSSNISPLIKPYIQNVLKIDLHSIPEAELGPKLGELIKAIQA